MMTKEKYEKMARVIRKHPQALGMLAAGNRILTALTYGAYILLLAAEAIGRDEKFCKVLLIPAAAFFLVTVFRKVCNAKRPYELLDIEPLLKRNKAGQSFPSRHAFSIFMIAMAIGYVWMPGGILFLILGVLLAVIRVIGGVHFPRDVAAGASIGILVGILGFYIW